MDMEAAAGKRKAASSSPEHERSASASIPIETTEKDHKRRNTMDSDVIPPLIDLKDVDGYPYRATVESGRDEDENEDEEEDEDEDEFEDDEYEEEDDYYPRVNVDGPDGMLTRMLNDFLHADENDAGPAELEVEQRGFTLFEPHNSAITLKGYRLEDGEDYKRWMQSLVVECFNEGKEIGRAYGRYVERNLIRSDFWRRMEEPCQELCNVAFEIFDRYGRVKDELVNHSVRKGTGCWGNEIDLGSFFVVEHAIIDRSWRRKGLGKLMIDSLLDKARSGERYPAFMLVCPGWLNSDLQDEIRGKTKREDAQIRARAIRVAVSFFRAIGFRRIGASSWFGLATDRAHEAHQIPLADDFDPLEDDEDTEVFGAEDDFSNIKDEAWRLKFLERLPLHHAAMTLPDDQCAEFYERFKVQHPASLEWVKPNSSGNNVLHIAASAYNVMTVRWLLTNVDEDQILSSARNRAGYIPSESLENKLENNRTSREDGFATIVTSDTFRGFSDRAVICLAALRGIMSPNSLQMLRLKFGCTCGQCIDGFLSPRMRFALLCQAEIGHDRLNWEIDDAEAWCDSHGYMIECVAKDIQQNMRTNKNYRRGFSNIFDHAAIVLRASNAPTISNIIDAWKNAREWPPATRNFYERGGTTESALHIIFQHARDQDEWSGDGWHMEVFEKDVNALPKCRNDLEYAFVAQACGVPDLHKWTSIEDTKNLMLAIRRGKTFS